VFSSLSLLVQPLRAACCVACVHVLTNDVSRRCHVVAGCVCFGVCACLFCFGGYGGPFLLSQLPRPEVSEDLQPPQKRSRVTKAGLQSEEDWVAAHPGAQPLIVSVPAEPDSGSWKLEGQTITVSVEFGKTVRELKQQLQGQLGDMPPNKMLLKSTDRGFLKDSFTLAHYNLRPGETLKLSAKRRGKKR